MVSNVNKVREKRKNEAREKRKNKARERKENVRKAVAHTAKVKKAKADEHYYTPTKTPGASLFQQVVGVMHTKPLTHKQIPDPVKEYARFADAAYKPMGDRVSSLGDMDSPYTYDNNLSNDTTGVWVDETAGTVIMSNRGTDIKSGEDLVADAGILVGQLESTNRFATADTTFSNIKHRYPNYKIILTGHSLGGAINDALFNKYGESIHQVHNFNKGSSPLAVSRSRDEPHEEKAKDDGSKVYNYFIAGDPLSVAGAHSNQNNLVFKPVKDSVNAHSIAQFYD